MIELWENEHIDELQRGGLRVIQRADAFRFGTDAVLLSDFASARRHDHVCDLGTGTGVIPLLLYGRENTITVDALELQPDMAQMAARSMQLNGLSDKICVHCGDLRQIRALLPHAQYDLVTCNPPYGKAGGTLLNPDDRKRIARHEGSCTIADVVSAASWLLRNGGRLCCVFPASRMAELLEIMQKSRFAPKRLRFVHARAEREAHLCLVEGMLDARPGLRVEAPLIIHDADGAYTPELKRIYGLDG